jgi:hypothetical protein
MQNDPRHPRVFDGHHHRSARVPRPGRYQKRNRILGVSTAVLGRFWGSLRDRESSGYSLPLVALVPQWRQNYPETGRHGGRAVVAWLHF